MSRFLILFFFFFIIIILIYVLSLEIWDLLMRCTSLYKHTYTHNIHLYNINLHRYLYTLVHRRERIHILPANLKTKPILRDIYNIYIYVYAYKHTLKWAYLYPTVVIKVHNIITRVQLCRRDMHVVLWRKILKLEWQK